MTAQNSDGSGSVVVINNISSGISAGIILHTCVIDDAIVYYEAWNVPSDLGDINQGDGLTWNTIADSTDQWTCAVRYNDVVSYDDGSTHTWSRNQHSVSLDGAQNNLHMLVLVVLRNGGDNSKYADGNGPQFQLNPVAPQESLNLEPLGDSPSSSSTVALTAVLAEAKDGVGGNAVPLSDSSSSNLSDLIAALNVSFSYELEAGDPVTLQITSNDSSVTLSGSYSSSLGEGDFSGSGTTTIKAEFAPTEDTTVTFTVSASDGRSSDPILMLKVKGSTEDR